MKNSDHHIVFDVTVNSRVRVLSTFFPPTSLYGLFSFVIIRLLDRLLLFLFNTQARIKRRRREWVRTICIHQWLAIAKTRSSRHVSFDQLFIDSDHYGREISRCLSWVCVWRIFFSRSNIVLLSLIDNELTLLSLVTICFSLFLVIMTEYSRDRLIDGHN